MWGRLSTCCRLSIGLAQGSVKLFPCDRSPNCRKSGNARRVSSDWLPSLVVYLLIGLWQLSGTEPSEDEYRWSGRQTYGVDNVPCPIPVRLRSDRTRVKKQKGSTASHQADRQSAAGKQPAPQKCRNSRRGHSCRRPSGAKKTQRPRGSLDGGTIPFSRR